MLAHAPQPLAGIELTYAREVFEAILAGMGWEDPFKAEYVCDDEGVRVKQVDTAQSLAWHPWCEVMIPGSPDPLVEPWLRFPFTARRLAALMTDGWGYFIQEKYGDWEDGPDEDEMLSIGLLGGKAKEVLRAAYEAYRGAVEMAPRLDRSLGDKARELTQQYNAAREGAMAREELSQHRHAGTEYVARLKRVNDTVSDLGQTMREARETADLAYARWRRDVVQHLLLPIEEVPTEAFASLMLRALPPSRRAEAAHQQQALQEFQDSEERKARWDLMSEQQKVERELRSWQLMQPQNITEAVLHDSKLKELALELAAIGDRLRSLEAPLRSAQEMNNIHDARPDYALLTTRDELCIAFGSFGLKRDWFDDLKSRQWLLDARKVLGHGQRGRRQEPLFCPFEVMIGLVEKSRKSKLNQDSGWRILENKFPAVYAAKSIGDHRDPTG